MVPIVQIPDGLIDKSPAAKPVTLSEKVRAKLVEVWFVGVVTGMKLETDGAGRSKVTKPTPLFVPIQLNPALENDPPAPPGPPQPCP